MIRTLASAALFLALACNFACKDGQPQGTTPPSDAADEGKDAGDATSTNGGAGEGEGANADETPSAEPAKPPGEDPTKKECDAQVGDAPASLFAESMLIRLPKGLEADKLVETTPMFISARNFESVSCVEGVPGAIVEFTAMGYFKDDPKKDIKVFRDEILKQLGYVDGLSFSEEVVKGRDLEVVVDVAADAKHPEPSRLWFVTKSKFGRLYYVVYAVHPNAWAAMRKTLKQSTDKMFLLQAK